MKPTGSVLVDVGSCKNEVEAHVAFYTFVLAVVVVKNGNVLGLGKSNIDALDRVLVYETRKKREKVKPEQLTLYKAAPC